MSNVGRRPILTEEETQLIIDKFVIENGSSHKIRYADVHRFCVELYDNDVLEKLPSESYWRKKDRMGRKLIDKTNEILAHKFKQKKQDNEIEYFMKIIDDNKIGEKASNLIYNELNNKNNEISSVNKKLNKANQKINELSTELSELKSINKQQEELIHQIYHYFFRKSNNSNMKVFESALKNIFQDPTSFLNQLNTENNSKEKKQHSSSNSDNTISNIFKNRLKQ